jgi:CDP-paratose 2-epimerase
VRILISGVCGFVGNAIAQALVAQRPKYKVVGFDNFIRPGSEGNRAELKRLGVRVIHADLRAASDVDALPACDWVIDAAANPSVLAGIDGRTSSRQLVEHNLCGTVNLLEYCKRNRAGLVLLSTSRVYGIQQLAGLRVQVKDGAFVPDARRLPQGASPRGIAEDFPTTAPVSLYGATKLASEALALEYGETFNLPVFVNRCGILAGAGQFGRPDQGIFAFWINSHIRRRPLKYIGFSGRGHQVRDCLHPNDLLPLILKQMKAPRIRATDRIVNVSGGIESAMSLLQLSRWCDERFGSHAVGADPAQRPFDIPWMVLDSSKAKKIWGWKPSIPARSILEEIAAHAGIHPDWLEISAPLG